MMRPRFTEAGKALQLRALAGTQITFTKMQLGDGSLGETNYKTLTALISPKATLSLSGIRIEDGSATVRGEFNNANMVEGFYYRELGLFAQDPDNAEQEILYCYANFGDECQYIAEPSSAMISRTVRIVATVDDAPNVTAILNDNAQYVDRTELMQILEQHNISETAHRNLMDFEVTYYVDSTTQEDADDRDGSEEHPFMTIQEAADAIPLSALRVLIYLKTGGATYVGLDDDYTFHDYQRIEISYAGSTETRPIICGHLRFAHCENVTVQSIIFNEYAGTSLEDPEYIRFNFCANAIASNVRGSSLANTGTFISSVNSAVSISNMVVLSAHQAVVASGPSANISMMSCTIDGGAYGITAYAGASVFVATSVDNSASTQCRTNYSGVIIDKNTADAISRGAVYEHLQSEANPHKVSLTQAQVKGGTIDVTHGGTGQTTFDAGALLKGNGTGGLAQILGTGALYAATSGSPVFGTLPVSAGGTGKTSIPNAYKSPMNGAHYGYCFISGTDYMIGFGRVSMNAGDNYTFGFDGYFDYYHMTDANYVLLFTNDDIETSHVNKYADSFTIDAFTAGTRVADFILIGKAEFCPPVVQAQ